MTIRTKSIRSDPEHLFERSGILGPGDPHHPFLVLVEEGEEMPGNDGPVVSVEIAATVERVLTYPDDTTVLWQWPGAWRSDYFHFTVENLRQAVQLRSLEIIPPAVHPSDQ